MSRTEPAWFRHIFASNMVGIGMWAESPGEGQDTTVSFVLPADGAAGQT